MSLMRRGLANRNAFKSLPALRRVDCFEFSDPQPRNSCRQVECLFPEQWGRWRERSEAEGVRSPRSADCRRPGAMELDSDL